MLCIAKEKSRVEFKKYQHVERFGTTEVEGIEFGICHIFPKIDGTNSSVWFNGTVQAGSRRRHISIDDDNAGFANFALNDERIKKFLENNPDLRLYGEWLVPHSLKTYRQDAWRKFYIFDVCRDKEDSVEYLPYEEYSVLLEEYDLDYIAPICTIRNADYEKLVEQLQQNIFLIEDGKGAGEGVVIKNYSFVNKYHRTTWAKIVTSEFKEKHSKVMGAPAKEGRKMVEAEIVEKYVTKALCEKELSKILNECEGWQSKFIPRILSVVFYSLVTEECWNFVKEFKNPKIDFKTLRHFCQGKTKEHLPQLF